MQISVKHNLDKFTKHLSDVGKKQLPFATSLALNKTAQIVREREKSKMKQVFDRPVPFTLNALQLTPATKANLMATVYFKTPSRLSQKQHYLEPQVFGGNREFKAFEKALYRIGILPHGMKIVPGSAAQIDAYGNISRGQIVKILSYFKAFGEQGYKANITEAKKKKLAEGTKRKLGYEYFVGSPGKKLPLGIWQRFRFAKGTAIKPVMIFVKGVKYTKRYDFFTLGKEVVQQEFEREFKKALIYALSTAK